jgi:hypothetical protein
MIESARHLVDVLIVNYKTPAYLRDCLGSVLSQDVRARVSVFDNASADGSVEAVLREFPDVNLLTGRWNYGFAAATNVLFRKTVAPYVMTLNPDAVLLPGALRACVDVMEREPSVALVSPFLDVDGQAVMPDTKDGLLDSSRLLARLLADRHSMAHARAETEVEIVRGTGYLCRRSALGADFFTEAAFLFGEEVELAERLRAGGGRLIVTDRARVRHEASVTFKFNENSFRVANRLAAAVRWRDRKRQFGRARALATTSIDVLDRAILGLGVAAKAALKGGASDGQKLALRKYRAEMQTMVGAVLTGDRGFVEANSAARRYFNRSESPGVVPEFEVVRWLD